MTDIYTYLDNNPGTEIDIYFEHGNGHIAIIDGSSQYRTDTLTLQADNYELDISVLDDSDMAVEAVGVDLDPSNPVLTFRNMDGDDIGIQISDSSGELDDAQLFSAIYPETSDLFRAIKKVSD